MRTFQYLGVQSAASGTSALMRAKRVHVPGPAVRAGTAIADRVGPRVSSLTRFHLEGIEADSVGDQVGTRTLRDHFASLAADER
ncbi:hypothetical protein [Brevibacterium senegalense]|uniref:hypothetical protein n=1 Tax=Brevibacterium senegalense TaxID=1033736 RepID=UPI0002FF0B24|nr:hypothetical protein [Brevibacterium senegalense]